MKSVFVLLLVTLMLTVACVSTQAATIYKITFDHGIMNPGPADYTAAANEVLPAGVHGVLLSADSISGDLLNPDVPGTQGGQVMNMMRGAAWPNKQGYFFGNDPVVNGDNYGTNTYPAYTAATQIGDAGPTIVNEYTIEVVVRPNYTDTGFGLTNVSPIFDSQRYDDITGGASIVVDQNDGTLTYQSGAPSNVGGITASTKLVAGTWYHIAVVVRKGAIQQTEIYVNGLLDGTGGYPATWETQGLFKIPGYFTIGTQYWPMSGRNFQGQIDALAISDTALDSGSFLLGTPVIPPEPEPEPASTIYKITFDHGVMDGPADYTAAANEVLPTGVHGVLLNLGQYPDATRRTGNFVNPSIPGTQGGQALNMMLGGAWANKQGYFFGRDPIVNGTNYGDATYPAYTSAMQIGDPGPVIANEYTLEAVVRPDYSTLSPPNINFGLTNVSTIFSSVRLDDVTGGAELIVDQVYGALTFNANSSGGMGNIYANTILAAGEWYHIAAVVRPSPTGNPDQQRTELWINGMLDEVGGYPLTWETLGLFKLPGYFTIGTQYWPMSGRNWQGQIDAIAISNVALDPSSFVLKKLQNVLSIPAAKNLDDVDPVSVRGTVTAAFTDYFYIEEPSRSSGIRVAKGGYVATVGSTAIVSGTMGTLPWGERQVWADTVGEIPTDAIAPLGMNNKTVGGAGAAADATGLANVGLLVRTTGKVSNSAGGSFNINDGSGVPLRAELSGDLTQPANDSYVAVTGISSGETVAEQNQRVILLTDWQLVE